MAPVEDGLLKVSAEVIIPSHEFFDGVDERLHVGGLTLVLDGLQDGALLGRQRAVLEACDGAQDHPDLPRTLR